MTTATRLLPLLTFALAGCSTVYTQRELHRRETHDESHDRRVPSACDNYVNGVPAVFGGTRFAFYDGLMSPSTCKGESCLGSILYPVLFPFALVDMAASLAADAILLPYTASVSVRCRPLAKEYAAACGESQKGPSWAKYASPHYSVFRFKRYGRDQGSGLPACRDYLGRRFLPAREESR